jgi:hypothetical protein
MNAKKVIHFIRMIHLFIYPVFLHHYYNSIITKWIIKLNLLHIHISVNINYIQTEYKITYSLINDI